MLLAQDSNHTDRDPFVDTTSHVCRVRSLEARVARCRRPESLPLRQSLAAPDAGQQEWLKLIFETSFSALEGRYFPPGRGIELCASLVSTSPSGFSLFPMPCYKLLARLDSGCSHVWGHKTQQTLAISCPFRWRILNQILKGQADPQS